MKHITLALFALAISGVIYAQTGLSNDLIWNSGEFSSEFVGGLNSMNDGMHYSSLEPSDAFGSRIVKFSYTTGEEVGTIASSKDIFNDVAKGIDGYEFSADEKQLLIQTETEGIYRYSFKANYFIFNLETKKTIPLADFSKGKQMLASFSPDGRKVAFVRNNNLFVFDTGTGKEAAITTDGEFNKIINGATDWVYEEEFAIAKGFEWSPLGDRIAYYRFDESEVKEFSMDMFGDLYPTQYKFKYPKAGEKNSTIQIWVWDQRTGKSTIVETGRGDIYIPRISWTNSNDVLCVLRMNRLQNKLEYLVADLAAAQPFKIDTKVLYTETANTYIDINDALTFLKDGSGFIILSEKDGYNHLYRFDMSGKQVAQLTKGAWEVLDFYGYDEANQVLYFSANLVKKAGPEKKVKGVELVESELDEISALQKHVFSQSLKKGGACTRLSTKPGTNDAEFSKGFKNFILTHSDANTPAHISLHTNTGKLIRVLKDNAALKDRLSKYKLAKKEFFTFKNASGTSLNCWMMKPANFNPANKYPVLVAIYGGPGSNTV
ncbi:MAG: DPP IV N-terminal domain-containing protein, partial [Flavobacteriales bacterium]|nr:DPP IV N-terminal domain-containing protein [Flavobacteriales bacterium]